MKKTATLLALCISIYIVNAQKYPEFVKVSEGTFIMGSNAKEYDNNEKPEHLVALSTYSISKTEVTVAQYQTYCKATGEFMPRTPFWGWHDKYPIVNVGWQDAIGYCEWLTQKLGKKVTLPTEAQWEYAARGGNQSKNYKFAGNNTLQVVGWCNLNAKEKAHQVATKKPNELGLYDMSGNVWEWCLDWYADNYYKKSPSTNPINDLYEDLEFRVVRGGAYYCRDCCNIINRDNNMPANNFDTQGFRVVSY